MTESNQLGIHPLKLDLRKSTRARALKSCFTEIFNLLTNFNNLKIIDSKILKISKVIGYTNKDK